jgi:hypothetical protein
MTSAAVQALSLVKALPDVQPALYRAENYLHSQQQSDGGFGGGSSFSTSWALQAISALGQSPAAWSTNVYNPNDYLAKLQQQDGGVEPAVSPDQTRVWATAYALPAALGKTWDSVLQSFAKPTMSTVSGGGTAAPTATTTAATSTIVIVVATSTQEGAATTSQDMSATTSKPVVIAPIQQSATTTVSVPAKKVVQKIKTVSKPQIIAAASQEVTAAPAPSETAQTQTASVANASTGSLFSRMWRTFASFFKTIF